MCYIFFYDRGNALQFSLQNSDPKKHVYDFLNLISVPLICHWDQGEVAVQDSTAAIPTRKREAAFRDGFTAVTCMHQR